MGRMSHEDQSCVTSDQDTPEVAIANQLLGGERPGTGHSHNPQKKQTYTHLDFTLLACRP